MPAVTDERQGVRVREVVWKVGRRGGSSGWWQVTTREVKVMVWGTGGIVHVRCGGGVD